MPEQPGDRQLGKPHFGGGCGEAVQHMDRKSRGVAV